MYNIAFNYLLTKYGYKFKSPTSKFGTRLSNCRNIKEKKAMLADATDRDYVFVINDHAILKDKSVDHQIYVLLGQYHLGSEPKIDLRNLLQSIGLM